jgi:hypothetical protein
VEDSLPWPALAQLLLDLLLPLLPGPWLAGWVRRLGWPNVNGNGQSSSS